MPLFDDDEVRETRVVLMPDGQFTWGVAEFLETDGPPHWVVVDARYSTHAEATAAMDEHQSRSGNAPPRRT